jgi:hypothetical protein
MRNNERLSAVPAEMSDAPPVIVVDGKICCFIQQTLGILVE